MLSCGPNLASDIPGGEPGASTVQGWQTSFSEGTLMSVPPESSEEGLVLAPRGTLAAEGSADKFEEEVHALFQEGHRHLVIDLRGVSRLDTTGIRALVRGHATAKRLGGSFKLVAPHQHVLRVLQLVHLDSVFEISESIESARARR